MEEIDELRSLLIQDRLFGGKLSESDSKQLDTRILNLYVQIITMFSADYVLYSENASSFFSVINSIDSSVNFQFKVFLDYFDTIYRVNVEKFDESVLGFSITENDDLFNILRNTVSKSSRNNFRSFIDEYNLDSYDKNRLESLAALLYEMVNHELKSLDIKEEDLHHLLMQYSILRQVAIKLGQIDFFYFSTFMYLERWSSLGYNQVARDFGATLLHSSFADSLPEYGFLISFYVASTQGNLSDSLFYGTICIILVKEKASINNKFLFQFLNSTLKLYRNRSLTDFLVNTYSQIPSNAPLTFHERIQLDFVYYSAVINSNIQIDSSHLKELISYIYRNLTYILERGEPECAPWLSILYNVRRVITSKGNNHGYLQTVNHLVSLLGNQVKSGYLVSLKKVSEGDINELKSFLNQLLIRLNQTRHVDDFVIDIDKAVSISGLLVRQSYNESDVDGMLLAMSVKADVSSEFKNEFAINRLNRKYDSELKIFNTPADKIKLNSILSDSQMIVYLCTAEDSIYQMSIEADNVQMYELQDWSLSEYFDWISEELPNLKFEDTKRERGTRTISQMFSEDYTDQQSVVKNGIKFSKLKGSFNKDLLLIKDMRLSAFPHNLLLGSDNEFISLKVPVVDVINTNWLTRSSVSNSFLPVDFNVGIWLPLEGGDWTIAYLASKMEQVLIDYDIKVFESSILEKPLSFDINILVAHGEQGIKSFAALHINHTRSTTRLDSLIGEGSVLVFFVCHSGSMNMSVFAEKVDSLVRYYLENGYKAVIAPFWALNILIPPIWLPIFLSKLKSGCSIADAVFYANKEVFNYYPTPAAWACMHLYGNAGLKIDSWHVVVEPSKTC